MAKGQEEQHGCHLPPSVHPETCGWYQKLWKLSADLHYMYWVANGCASTWHSFCTFSLKNKTMVWTSSTYAHTYI